MMNSIASKLFNSARHLKRKGAWTQDTFKDAKTGAVCAIGEVWRYTGKDAVPFLYAALPARYKVTFKTPQSAIITYNDRWTRKKRDVVKLFNRAGSLALKTKGDAKLLSNV